MIAGHASRLAAAIVVVGVSVLAPGAHAASNIFNQFTVASNPHLPWTYLGGTNLATETSLSTVYKTSCDNSISHTRCWYNGEAVPNARSVIKNLTKKTIHYLTIILPTDHLSLDPENGAVSVQWTAPSAGNYQIAGDFLGDDTSERSHPVEITDGAGSPLFSATLSSYGQSQPFNFQVTLAKGQAVNFAVLTGSTYANLSTGLAGTITKLAK